MPKKIIYTLKFPGQIFFAIFILSNFQNFRIGNSMIDSKSMYK